MKGHESVVTLGESLSSKRQDPCLPLLGGGSPFLYQCRWWLGTDNSVLKD